MSGISDALEFNQDKKNYNLKLEILDKNKKVAEFFVAVADTDKKRLYGLMNLKNFPRNNGMLFVFDKAAILNMWMKNTNISLDMIFIDENNKIINIAENTTPFSLDVISSQLPCIKVLEINGGLSKILKIKVGQRVMH
jgi:uncharacterized membrane protein (UPF0127 family)